MLVSGVVSDPQKTNFVTTSKSDLVVVCTRQCLIISHNHENDFLIADNQLRQLQGRRKRVDGAGREQPQRTTDPEGAALRLRKLSVQPVERADRERYSSCAQR